MKLLAGFRQILAGRRDRVDHGSGDASFRADRPVNLAEEGAWSTEWRKGKLRVFGTFRSPQCATVTARIAGTLVKQIPVVDSPEHGFSFSFAFGKSSLLHFPSRADLSIDADGAVIVHSSGQPVLTVDVPSGDGMLSRRLDEGYVIDKWGQLKLPISLKPEWGRKVLALYEEFSDYFENRFAKRPFFIAGSLLGLIRENDFLPFDDDMDIGYFSTLTKPEAVRDEMFEMLKVMIHDGLTIRVGHNGGFYKVGTPEADFDVFPSWHYKARVWLPQSQSMPSDPTLMHPPKAVNFLGARVFIPNRPEDYLALHYGEGWRVPDPHYVERKRPGVLKGLRRARLTQEQLTVLADMQRR